MTISLRFGGLRANEPHGPESLRVEVRCSRVSGSAELKTMSLVAERSRRRRECSSEHVAWTPRPGTWRLHFILGLASRPSPHSKRPDAPAGRETVRSAGPFLASGRLLEGNRPLDPRPLHIGAAQISGMTRPCQPVFVRLSKYNARCCICASCILKLDANQHRSAGDRVAFFREGHPLPRSEKRTCVRMTS